MHPPARLAHLGLGAFHRSHQAWFTHHANSSCPEDQWGFVSFTGRSVRTADQLTKADGVFTLIERSADGDRLERIESIVRAERGDDFHTWCSTLANPEIKVLTVTVTESGYAEGAIPPDRIAGALIARAAVNAGPISIVSCDNLNGNGAALRRAVLRAAGDQAKEVDKIASFVDTVVDRITPAATAEDIRCVRELSGFDDPSAVVAEPFAEWVLTDNFADARPAWEAVGARVVEDVTPYEQRKLWLLNAGHTFLAAAGRLRRYETIAEAYADPDLNAEVEALWAEQRRSIRLDDAEINDWLAALRVRLANPRIAHRLEQIAQGSSAKIAPRLLTVLRHQTEAGMTAGEAQLSALDTWVRSIVELEPLDQPTAGLARDLETVARRDRVTALIEQFTPAGAS
ncbi:D-mannonate oxidoreductase [Microbacterium esteraromaticum]|uniref:D-mannonate oxidoreductase n=1 Tax=Microbacterium esteraromaticum TaxID=57043 RepID=A0A1R4IPD7_9MICO|nr:D-mannonate oxidoreductase [Microbacterium esteraromaticum]